jgi:hypothetical protein
MAPVRISRSATQAFEWLRKMGKTVVALDEPAVAHMGIGIIVFEYDDK